MTSLPSSLRTLVRQADGLVIATPEYNHPYRACSRTRSTGCRDPMTATCCAGSRWRSPVCPLDFSTGSLTLSICNTDSLGERIQREFPPLRVVKSLNTCNCHVMVNPARVSGEHDVFVCGNDAAAKEHVTGLLREFGWRSVIDLGDITAARATEQLLPMWVRLYGLYGTADFNFRIVRG